MPKKLPVIAIFDIGKTNKKVFLFDQEYRIVYEQSAHLKEIADGDGFPCEDVSRLKDWVVNSLSGLEEIDGFEIIAVNVSAYGASFVHLDRHGEFVTPLYNYLKPYPQSLASKFYREYGGEEMFSLQTASPALGNLNSGLQLYRLKCERPDLFQQISYSLHLPQYISGLITRQAYSDITSIGCHTGLWDFTKRAYHDWVLREGIADKLAPLFQNNDVTVIRNGVKVGVGIHDSSAALIPYLAQFNEPFVLLSTGTWSISLNPFNRVPLAAEELRKDCLCYLDFKGNPVKASRLFAGHEHEEQTKRLGEHFHVGADYYKEIRYDPNLTRVGESISTFRNLDLSRYKAYEEAYHQLIADLVADQAKSTLLVMKGDVHANRIFVDGGFSDNRVFMNMLAKAFPMQEVFAASVHQASALGAALAIHSHWNSNPEPSTRIELSRFI